jgi:hypothetical protein
MNKARSIPVWLLAGLAMILGRAAEPASLSQAAARSKQVRARIDLLFRHRDESPGPIGLNQNPFRTPADMPPASNSSTAAIENAQPVPPAFPTSDEALLTQAVSTLKVSGVVVAAGQTHVSINQETYNEGSIITARVQGVPVYLRVLRIASDSVTFGLNGSEKGPEVTQRF